VVLAGLALVATHRSAAAAPVARPNILWITSEDHGPHLGAYGDPHASTPHITARAMII
jgi:uncharacterized sulfatase